MKRVLLVFLITFSTFFMVNGQKNAKIIYVGDPMCSWCYGFSKEISNLKESMQYSLGFEIMMGGLRPFHDDTITSLKSFLHGHWSDVHTRTGQPFNYEILNDSSVVYDTEPPARAVVTVRNMNKDIVFDFFKDVQHLFYVENKDPGKVESYYPLLKKHQLDQEKFVQLFQSPEMRAQVKQDFSRAQQMDVRGFPTVLLEMEGKYTVLSRGYTTAKVIHEHLSELFEL